MEKCAIGLGGGGARFRKWKKIFFPFPLAPILSCINLSSVEKLLFLTEDALSDHKGPRGEGGGGDGQKPLIRPPGRSVVVPPPSRVLSIARARAKIYPNSAILPLAIRTAFKGGKFLRKFLFADPAN